MPNSTLTGSTLRRPWTQVWVQGWRHELTATVLSWSVLGVAASVASWAPVLVIVCALIVAWRRPDLRDRFRFGAQARHAIRRFNKATWLCMIIGRDGRIPTVMEISITPVGNHFLVRLPVGMHFEPMEARAPEIASALGARSVLVKPVRSDASLVEILEVRTSAFPEILQSNLTGVRQTDLWQPFPFGIAEDGNVIHLGLPEHNVLIGGEPGSGKSVALSSIVAMAALDPSVSITLLDGKQVELAAWAEVAETFCGPDLEEAISALTHLQQLMDERYRVLLADRRRKIEPSGSFGLRLVVIDELAFYLRGGKKADRDAFAELLRDLISRGRAAGIIVVAATQKPSHEVVPTWIRDLFAFRLAMRCSSNEASDTILGSGWATQGFSAVSIEPRQRGVGYLLAEGGTPILMKLPFLSDDDIDQIAKHAAELRGSP